ncbi:MAG: hypothetical protein DPW18_14610 [Chloroflexi bacterium]|nr:hypothetical protein [Chloroflexota bacterium]MDL1942082.1 hypothetical protein [Chloroflexi bacterium CFX2]
MAEDSIRGNYPTHVTQIHQRGSPPRLDAVSINKKGSPFAKSFLKNAVGAPCRVTSVTQDPLWGLDVHRPDLFIADITWDESEVVSHRMKVLTQIIKILK